MKRRLLAILLAVALAPSVASAQIQTCTISGTVYLANGQPFVGAKIIVHRVRAGSVTGPLISAVPTTYLTNAQGAISFLLPRDSWAWIEAPIEGLFVAGGVPVYIPNAGSAELKTLPSNVKLPQQVPIAILTPQSVLDPGSSGFVVRTTLNVTIPRSIAVGSNLSVTNGNGVDGNPTVNLGANVVTSVVNDTNLHGVIASNQLTLSWTGTLAKARQHSATVYNDQANIFLAGAQDFGAAASLKVPTGAGAAPTASGVIAFDSTDNLYKGGVNGVNKTFQLTDGSGAGLTNLNATNLGSGTVPLARLSGITTTQLSAGAAIANSQLANSSVTVNGTTNQVSISGGGPVSLGGALTISLTGPHNFTTLTSNGVLYGNGTGATQATSQGVANSVLTANAGAPLFSPTPSLDRLTVSPGTLVFDLASGVLAVNLHMPYSSTIAVASGKVFDHVRFSKTNGQSNVFDLAGTAIASGVNYQLESESTSGASSALYGVIGQLSNKSPGAAKAIYGRTTMQSGSTGIGIGGVFAVTGTSSAQTNWILQIGTDDFTDQAIHIHADDQVDANISEGIVFATDVRVETNGAFLKAFGTAGHNGDFLSYANSSGGANLFKVDKDGNAISAGILSLGTNPSASGAVRLPNAACVSNRNQANNADIPTICLNSSNEVEIGGLLRNQTADPSFHLGSSSTGWSLQRVDSNGRLRIFRNGTGEYLAVSAAGVTNLFKGADVASATSITPTGNTFVVTGTTTISTISTTNITAGTVLTMITTSAGLVFDEAGNIDITNGTSLTSTANGLVISVWDGTKWRTR